MNQKPSLRQLLFRPVIFVTISLGLLVIGELVAIGRLTWMNNQRIHTIEADIGEGRHLEESIFELLQLQLKLAASVFTIANTIITTNTVLFTVLKKSIRT